MTIGRLSMPRHQSGYWHASTLITSAPRSAMCRVASGPAQPIDRSTMRTPSSGSLAGVVRGPRGRIDDESLPLHRRHDGDADPAFAARIDAERKGRREAVDAPAPLTFAGRMRVRHLVFGKRDIRFEDGELEEPPAVDGVELQRRHRRDEG